MVDKQIFWLFNNGQSATPSEPVDGSSVTSWVQAAVKPQSRRWRRRGRGSEAQTHGLLLPRIRRRRSITGTLWQRLHLRRECVSSKHLAHAVEKKPCCSWTTRWNRRVRALPSCTPRKPWRGSRSPLRRRRPSRASAAGPPWLAAHRCRRWSRSTSTTRRCRPKSRTISSSG